MAKLRNQQERGRELGELQPFFDSARSESVLPDRLERAIIQDARRHQAKLRNVQRTSFGNAPRSGVWRWRLAGLFTASAGAGLAIGMGSAGAVEAITSGFGTVAGVAGADIFSGLESLLLE